MKNVLLALICASCFREAPPCDSATLERIKRECPTEDECIRQLDERAAVCAARFRRGE